MKNKKTIEQAAESYANNWEDIHFELDSQEITPIEVSKIDFIAGVKWQQEQEKKLYTEEELLKILHDYRNHFEVYRNIQVLPNMFFKWFENVKKR